MPQAQQSQFYKRGDDGAGCYIGACPGKFEEQQQVPFSRNGQSGINIRATDATFDQKTLINVSTEALYRPKTKRTQPTVAQCLRDAEHIAFLKMETERVRRSGGRVITVGAIARDVCRRAGIPTDDAMPHPSGRNAKRWRDWVAQRAL